MGRGRRRRRDGQASDPRGAGTVTPSGQSDAFIPGPYVGFWGGDPGRWVIEVRGGPAFAANCVHTLRLFLTDELRPDSGRRECLQRMIDALERAGAMKPDI